MFFLINIYENCTNPFDWSRQYSLVQITKNTNIFQLSFHQKELFLTLMTISWINYQINLILVFNENETTVSFYLVIILRNEKYTTHTSKA